MAFDPIAIVGRGCVLPDALDPDRLWRNVEAGRSALSAVPGERWRVPAGDGAEADERSGAALPAVGGYVRGFEEVFDPSGFLVDAAHIVGLDPMFHWVLHGARQALRESGAWGASGHHARLPDAGLILGNLCYPNESASRFAEHVWLDGSQATQGAAARDRGAMPDACNWFTAGLPANVAACALGLGAGGYALDAACASGLYAIKLACDRLHDGSAGLMIAGAVNRADNLFLHRGFGAISAVSGSGRSRPFHRDADGLVPAEGAGFVALMRLRDALAAGAPIFGVVRGVGLSNDGRGDGLLVPSRHGQVRAMRLAYAQAGIDPRTVSLIEAHATGTRVGDAVEARALAEVFADSPGVPIGSVKSYLGHTLATAGMAGLLTVLGAMRAGVRPAAPEAAAPIDELTGTPLRLLARAEDWPGTRRAGVNAFGFGGANAHLIVDAWHDTAPASLPEPAPAPPSEPSPSPSPADGGPVAVVALGARVGDGVDTESLRRALLRGEPNTGIPSGVDLAVAGLCFPPADLAVTQTRQILLLAAAEEAVAGVALPRERTAVLVGAGNDPLPARYGARWRTASLLGDADEATVSAARDSFAPPLTSAAVSGTMPSLTAHRASTRFDLGGPAFVVCAEEASGIVALELAARALRGHEVDAAVVGAVDLADEPVLRAALADLGAHRTPGTAAVVLVLKRLADARRDGDEIVAVMDDAIATPPDLVVGDDDAACGSLAATATEAGPAAGREAPSFDPATLFGTAHAASGMVSVAAATLALWHRALPRAQAPALALDARTVEVRRSVLRAPAARLRLSAGAVRPWAADEVPRLRVYSGEDRRDVAAALAAGRETAEPDSAAGGARLVMVTTDTHLAERQERAHRWLAGEGVKPPGTAYRDTPVAGQTAFVFTNGSAAYPGMGHELALALPDLVQTIESASGLSRSLLTDQVMTGTRDALDQIMSTGVVIGLHTALSRSLLGEPDALIGYSSGETAAMIAMGIWQEVPTHCAEFRESGLFDREIGGEYRAVRRVWQRAGIRGERWASYLVSMPADRVNATLSGEPALHLMAVNAPGLCVVGGEAEACAAWVRRQAAHAVPITYDMAAHSPELAEIKDQWWELHHRPTREPRGIRVYSCASGESYEPTARRVADALTAQVLGTIDYVRVIERAWADGVRVFVEHGPRNLCTSWISRILGDREHVAVAMDAPQGRSMAQVGQVVAELAAAGVPMNADALFDRWAAAAARPARTGARLRVPVASTEVELVARRTPETMAAAPRLPATAWYPPAPRDTTVPNTTSPNPAKPDTTVPATAAPTRQAALVRVGRVAEARDRITAAHRAALADRAEAWRLFSERRAEAQRAFMRTSATTLTAMIAAAGTTGTIRDAAGEPSTADRPTSRRYPGPEFDRSQLEFLAHGSVSALFGRAFAEQDGRRRQTRLPRPPMLLVDRVLGIDGEPGALRDGSTAATGTIWTETDVQADSWYLDPAGRMPAGIMVEAGQADLLLISWLGADLRDREDRVYRLLGCELTTHGSLPLPDDTLRYEIHVDGHAEHHGVRLFFFHYDCYVGDELRLTVRDGQAGFFTDDELASSPGMPWTPSAEPPLTMSQTAGVEAPTVATASGFGAERVRAFAAGRPADCFGAGWEATRAHVRSPRISDGRMLLLDEVTLFDPAGGPWARGYLRAETRISADDWFFDGHFENDPCMPGTLMFEGASQAMAFYLAAGGHTIDRDGWRFEIARDCPTRLRCRHQVTPDSSLLVYEVFVSKTSAGPEPTLVADVLCSVDGVQAFHASGLTLRLVPDWPLEQWRRLGPHRVQLDGTPVPLRLLGGLRDFQDDMPCAAIDGVRYDYSELLASAWGRPTRLAGSDPTRKPPRLPGPPFHFVSRIVSAEVTVGAEHVGDSLVAEYDVPDRAWYFEQNGCPTMPMAVLLEIALQPCGCLAAHASDARGEERDLFFRNLDGTGTVLGEVTPATHSVRTEVRLRGVARHDGMIIETFDIDCRADGEPLARYSAVFGFFPKAALAGQTGLPVDEDDLRRLHEPCERTIDLDEYRGRAAPGARLAGPMLLMLDRVTGFWPDGGRAGLGRLRAEKDIDAADWYFKAHFFQDPVQPGSLGIEAICQLLQLYLLTSGRVGRLVAPRFEPLMLGQTTTWRYRGQILPTDAKMTVEMDIVRAETNAHECHAVAEAWLWIDGRRVYHVRGLGMRAVSTGTTGGADAANVPPASFESVLDLAEHEWLLDHRPTWTVPSMPLMAMVDHLARAAGEHTGQRVAGLSDVQVWRWLTVEEPVRLRTEIQPATAGVSVTLSRWRDAVTAELSRFERVAGGTVRLGPPPAVRPEPFAALTDAVPLAKPYTSGAMFHGPAFHYMTALRTAAAGTSSVLDASRGRVPRGWLNQGVLDAALHGLPCQEMERWSARIDASQVAVPYRLRDLTLYEPLPDEGPLRVEARFSGFVNDDPLLPNFDIQVLVEDRVAVAMRLTCTMVRLTMFDTVPIEQRRAFLRDRLFVPGLGLSTAAGQATVLTMSLIDKVDVLPGTVAHVYGLPRGGSPREHAAVIAIKDHAGRLLGVHPTRVEVAADLRSAQVAGRPETLLRVEVVQDAEVVTIRSSG